MFLNRLALRLAVLEVLRPTGGTAATMAGAQVYDTQIQPQDLTALPAQSAFVVVRTLEDDVEPQGSGRDLQAHAVAHRVTLALELSMVKRQANGEMAVIESGAAIEGLLDLLAWQIDLALREARQLRPLADVLIEIGQANSRPFVEPDAGVLLAGRSIHYRCRLIGDANADFAASGLARLPRPLRAVAEALPANAPGRALCVALAGRLVPPPALPDLAGVDLDLGSAPTEDAPRVAAQIDL